nr:YdcF family protein [Actinokineospora sp. NBRC 105648]
MGHGLRRCDAAVVLGSHDIGVATRAAELYQAGYFPVVVFSGANSPATADCFPRGEAIHYREHALGLGVPESAILVESEAANTGQNILFSRAVLAAREIFPRSLLLVSMPYMERRAYATTRKLYPGVDVVCASESGEFVDYVRRKDDSKLVIDMIVGDLQRVVEYPKSGFAIPQEVPATVIDAYRRLVDAGFDSCLIKY